MCPRSERNFAASWARAMVALSLVMAVGEAEAQTDKARSSRQEETRRKLLEQVGLEKQDKTSPPEPSQGREPGAPSAGSQPDAAVAPAPAAEPGFKPVVRPTPATAFVGAVHEALLTSCRPCHAVGGIAATTRLRFDGAAVRDHAVTRRFVDLAAPRRSLLLTKATGVAHGGGPTIAAGGEIHRRLLQWIIDGAEAEATRAASSAATSPQAARRSRTPAVVPSLPLPAAPSAVPAAPAPPAAAAPADEGATAAGDLAAAGEVPAAATDDAAARALAVGMHVQLVRACLPCHRSGGPAGLTRYTLEGVLEADLAASRRFVDAARSSGSPLVAKAEGLQHGGGVVWPKQSAGHESLRAWLAAGAPSELAAGAPPADEVSAALASTKIDAETAAHAPGKAEATPAAAGVAAPPAAAPSSAPSPPGRHGGVHLSLLGQELTLNGRFDVNLERRGFGGDPFGDGSHTALQSYHHFVFLGRQSAEDPFVLTAELTSLEFYEAGVRLGPRRRGVGLHVRAGKLLVPFGTEPLFHQSYGGHVGFDQRVLPAVWAAEGLAASGHLEVADVTLSADVYGVRGHALRDADAVLNLQGDLSPVDDARPALGLRLRAAFASLTGYYSAYFNPLGHDRRLFMQALDLSLWRWRGLPVLDRLVLGVGLLRADVSGGGSGVDHFHFASYWLARVYAFEWLSVQYRQGLRTFDNKRNLTFDGRRRGVEDGSTHNLAVVARYRGLSVALTHFLNLEKADEVDDDLLRLAVAYEF